MSKIQFDGLKAKKMQLLEKVNSVKNADYIGTNEMDDVVDLYYEVCEEIEKSKEVGEKPSALELLSQLGSPLVSAVSGGDEVIAEASDLSDEEILESVARSKNFKLGDNAVMYEQGIKILLFTVQSFFVFKS